MSTDSNYVMNTKLGVITMLISSTGMGLVPLFGRWATRTDMFDNDKGFNAGNSIGALMATGRMTMGIIFFVCLVLMTKKVKVWKELRVTPAIIMGGVMIGLSLGCYVTSTLLTTVANAVLLIYIGPVVCILLARIFRKEPMSVVHYVCLVAVFVGMLFGNQLMGFGAKGFFVNFNLAGSTPKFPLAGLGNMFGFLSGIFYGSSMFFNGYRKDADTAARGVWNFIAAAVASGSLALMLHLIGAVGHVPGWALDLHLTPFNWIGAVLLWIICGPVALGLLLVAGRNLPAADYGIIAYWEVPVALFIGLLVFKEDLTINTVLGFILVVGGGMYPSINMLRQNRKNQSTSILEVEERSKDIVETTDI